MLELNQLPPNARLLPWHIDVWQKLTGRFPQLGHALLLHGKQGSGKQQFALYFSKWLLCQNKQAQSACGHCASCAWVQAGTHPQVKIIQADFDEKKQIHTAIKVDQIRDLSDFIQQTVEGWRVVLIYPAEQLNIAASNALLKTLEEPGERVVLILISDAMLRLPATIRSRVQKFALDRIVDHQAFDYLQHKQVEQQHEIHAEQLRIALALAADMPLKAQEILHSAWFAQRTDFVKDWYDLVHYKNQPMKFSTHWMKQLDFRQVLFLLRYSVQDLVAIKLQQPVKQTDLQLEKLANDYSLEQLFAISEQINKITVLLAQNVQSQLIFDELTMRLMNVN